MKGIYFEEKGVMLLEHIGMTKSEFARRMGIQRQNVNALFFFFYLEIISRAADVLGVSFALLVSFVEEPDVFQLPVPERDVEGFDGDCAEILPEDVPVAMIPPRRAFPPAGI